MLHNYTTDPYALYQIKGFQDNHVFLKELHKIQKVDVYDAEQGGGYGDLSQALHDCEVTEELIDYVEFMLDELGGEIPMDDVPFATDPLNPDKLRRYYNIFCPCEAVDLPGDLGGGFAC